MHTAKGNIDYWGSQPTWLVRIGLSNADADMGRVRKIGSCALDKTKLMGDSVLRCALCEAMQQHRDRMAPADGVAELALVRGKSCSILLLDQLHATSVQRLYRVVDLPVLWLVVAGSQTGNNTLMVAQIAPMVSVKAMGLQGACSGMNGRACRSAQRTRAMHANSQRAAQCEFAQRGIPLGTHPVAFT